MKRPPPPITIIQAMTDPHLFGCWFFPSTSWLPWHAVLAALFALPMTAAQAALFRQHTGRGALPIIPAREGWLVVGRRGGKSRIAASPPSSRGCFTGTGSRSAPSTVSGGRRARRLAFLVA